MKVRMITVLLSMLPIWAMAINIYNDSTGRFLKAGDKMPDISFRIYNYKNPTARISDFKGKAVILDLWGIHCAACIEGIPRMQALQKKFGDSLQIIMITKDDVGKVRQLATHSDNVKNNDLPSVMGDSIAYLFDYSVVPTQIWIDAEGKIQYIANGRDATEKNVGRFIRGDNTLSLKEKKDIYIDRSEPLLVNWYPYEKAISLYTYLAPYNNNYTMSGGVGIFGNTPGSINKVWLDNSPLIAIYKIAFGYYFDKILANNRIIVEGSWPGAEKLRFDRATGLNLYNYELIEGIDRPTKSTLSYIQKQLDYFIKAKSHSEKRSVKCLVLRKKDNHDYYLSKGGIVKYSQRFDTLTWQNINWGNLVRRLTIGSKERQLIDETGIADTTKVDLKMSTNWSDISEINRTLERYGLTIKEETKPLDCIIIKEDKD